MVRLKGQLLSMSASGSLAKTLTYSNWKGRAYVKKYSQPTNNEQLAQLGMRAAMGFLSKEWTLLSTADKDSWNELAAADVVSEFDSFIGYNLLRNAEGLAPTKALPAVQASFEPTAIAQNVTPFPTFIDISFTCPPTPESWNMTLFRSDGSGFTPGTENMVHQVPCTTAPTITHIRDVPPFRGFWYYRFQTGDPAGNKKLHIGEPVADWT